MSKGKSPSSSGRGAGSFGHERPSARQNALPTSPPALASAFSRALALHREGRLHEAREGYRQVAKAQADHYQSRHLLGVVCHQLGDHAEAVRQFDAALKVNPRFVAAHINRGVALEQLRRLDEALASYDRAIALDPADADTFYNRGNALKEMKRFAEAVTSYDRAIALNSSHAGACYNRGNALRELERLDAALASYERAITLKPDHVDALINRGITLYRLKQFDAALASHERAVALKPDHVEALINRGIALHELKRFDAALASFDSAIAFMPDRAEAYNTRGVTLQALKRLDAAVASYDKAVALRPDYAEALSNRADALREMRRFDEALASCEQAIALNPGHAEAYTNRGIVLMEMRQFGDALASYDRAIVLKPGDARTFYNRGIALLELSLFEAALASYDHAIVLKPDYADAFNNRSIALRELNRFGEAAESCARALALNPEHNYALGGLADCAMKVCDWTQRDELSEGLRRQVTERNAQVPPFLLLGYSDDAALHLVNARRCVLDRFGLTPRGQAFAATWRNERIRVAYLSSDFRLHVVSILIAELFELHDRSRFEVIGISFGPDDGSEMRRRLVAGFDRFVDVRMTSDQEVARLLRELRVDIAVDLNGYTGSARPGIFALRPAPIQVSYLGFPATTGADFIDYIIADAIALPFGQQPHYAENIVHLPDCYMVNDRKRTISANTPTREECGLPADGFVFCCFNGSWKITPAVFDVWARLLKAVEGSVLWLSRDNAHAETNLRKEAAARGIESARLVFADRLPRIEDHLARHRVADLFLDTVPFNAHTTASDALWAGLPVVTCRGKTFAGRVAASLLGAIGLPKLVTETLEDYEALALRIASDASLRRALRGKLDRNRMTTPLFDSDRFRRHIEAAYVTMWGLWQRGEPPRSFSVEPQRGDHAVRGE